MTSEYLGSGIITWLEICTWTASPGGSKKVHVVYIDVFSPVMPFYKGPKLLFVSFLFFVLPWTHMLEKPGCILTLEMGLFAGCKVYFYFLI